ncbi:MAG TPA: phosphohistidine phosphatase SixA [Thermodesulfobacteriota bacterium]|nr:phosphohistidine phosphatase SixA [Thermodesulfobacteriota bacterium]
MILYLVQHAESKSRSEDPAKGLTDRGFFTTRKTAHYMAGLNVTRPSVIFHSGKKRAEQTAMILKDELNPPKGFMPTNGLAPDDDPNYWAEKLKHETTPIMLVGHLPHLERLASLLINGDGEKKVVDFKNAGIVCLHRGRGMHWWMEWIITPDLVR